MELTFVEQLQSSSTSDFAEYRLLPQSSAPSYIYFLPLDSTFHQTTETRH